MLRFFTVTAASLLAASASAQTFSYPRVWCFHEPLHASPDMNQYRTIIGYSTAYGLHNPTTNPGYASVAASEIFGAVSTQVAAGHNDNAVLLFSVGTSGMPTHGGTATGVTSLYAHSGDAIQNPGSAAVTLPFTWTPWKVDGIAATKTWMEDFVDAYKALQSATTSAPYKPRPSRFFFDDEVMVIGDNATDTQMEAYWNLLKLDTRFSSTSTVLVPGTGQNLYSLWTAAGSPDFVEVTSGYNWKYKSGSSGNQAWWNWWSGICRASVAGAMDEAYYGVVRAKWTTTPDPGFSGTGVVPLCSDYDGSLRLDSVANAEFGSRISNGYQRKDYPGALNNGIGERIVWDAPGSNVVQSPNIYAGFAWYHAGYYNPALTSPDPEADNFGGSPFTYWANTDDDWTSFFGTAAQEAWSTVSLRGNRFELDALHRSTNGRTTPIVPWVPMANEMSLVDGMETKYDFRGVDYDTGKVPVNLSVRHLTRILAAARARGSNEMIQWNWGSYSPAPFGNRYNYGPDSQYAQNWEYFNEAVKNVWGYQIDGTYMDTSATSVVIPPSGHPQYGVSEADLLRESDRSYSNTYTGRVRIDSLTGSVGTWYVVKFVRDGTNLGTPSNDGTNYLEIDIEGIANVDADCYLYIRGDSSSWVQVTDGGTVDHWGNSIRDSGFKMPADRTARVHARIPYSSDYFSGGHCHLALHVKPHSLTGTVSVWTDLVQMYGTHDVKRPAGDINGDYVVNSADSAMLYDLITNSGHRTKGTDVAVADMNGDGVIDSLDYLFYTSASSLYNEPAEDDYMSSFEFLRP